MDNRFAGIETGGSDVMGKLQCLTASQGSDSEETGCRACEMSLNRKSLPEKESDRRWLQKISTLSQER